MGHTIYLADDEKSIRELLHSFLTSDGYEVRSFESGDALLAAFQQEPAELVILDIMMPGKSGVEVCREIRKSSQVPIVMLTAKGEEVDKIVGLELGADDYIVKPFSPREVIARIKAILRRTEKNEGEAAEKNVIRHNGLVIDLNSYTVLLRNQPVVCTPKEIEILYLLASHPGQVFTRDTLLSQVWGYDFAGETRTVDTHIKRLRAKLDSTGLGWSIKTIYGVGYKFEIEQ